MWLLRNLFYHTARTCDAVFLPKTTPNPMKRTTFGPETGAENVSTKSELRVSIDPAVKAGLDALAKVTGRQPGAVVESALRLILDPLPAFAQAQALLAAHQQRTTALEDQVRVIADYIVDARRASDARTES